MKKIILVCLLFLSLFSCRVIVIPDTEIIKQKYPNISTIYEVPDHPFEYIAIDTCVRYIQIFGYQTVKHYKFDSLTGKYIRGKNVQQGIITSEFNIGRICTK